MAQAHSAQNRPVQPTIGPFNPNKNFSEPERWMCIYPAYLNALKTKQEGRIICKSKAVENPTYLEIRDVLTAAGYTPIVENKQYSRERSKELEYRQDFSQNKSRKCSCAEIRVRNFEAAERL